MNIKDIKNFIDYNIIYEGEIKGKGEINIINFNNNNNFNENYLVEIQKLRYKMYEINNLNC